MANTHKDHPVLSASLYVAECLQKLKAFSLLPKVDCVKTGNLNGLIEELKQLTKELASEFKIKEPDNSLLELFNDLNKYQTILESVEEKITERVAVKKGLSIPDAKKNFHYLCMNFSEKRLCDIEHIYYQNHPYLQGLVVLELSKDNYVEKIIKETVEYHYEKAKNYIDKIMYDKEDFRGKIKEYNDKNLEDKIKYKALGMMHFVQLYQFTQCSGMLKEQAEIKLEALLYMIELVPSQRAIERRLTMV